VVETDEQTAIEELAGGEWSRKAGKLAVEKQTAEEQTKPDSLMKAAEKQKKQKQKVSTTVKPGATDPESKVPAMEPQSKSSLNHEHWTTTGRTRQRNLEKQTASEKQAKTQKHTEPEKHAAPETLEKTAPIVTRSERKISAASQRGPLAPDLKPPSGSKTTHKDGTDSNTIRLGSSAKDDHPRKVNGTVSKASRKTDQCTCCRRSGHVESKRWIVRPELKNAHKRTSKIPHLQ
jgi:hypothetical protein